MSDTSIRILILMGNEACPRNCQALREGAEQLLNGTTVEWDVVESASLQSLPLLLRFTAQCYDFNRSGGEDYDGYIVLGRGAMTETNRECQRKLNDIAVDLALPLASDLFDERDQSPDKLRARGRKAAEDCLALIEVRRSIGLTSR